MNDGGCVAVSPHSSNIVFCVGNVYNSAYYFAVAHSSNGTTFERDTLALGTRGWAVAFDPVDSNRVYVGGDSAYSYPCLLITTDCGQTWTQSRSGLNGAVWTILVDPTDPQKVYAGTNNGVFRSTNAGATWTATTLTQQTRSIVIDPFHPDNLFAGTYGQGVYATTNGGTTWTQMNAGLTNAKILSLAIRPGAENTIFAGTEGSSIFRTEVSTAIAQPGWTSLPGRGLAVTPSPCRGPACIEFAPDAAGPVAAAIFDRSGRKVIDLGLRSLPAAPVEWRFDVGSLDAGIYFIRVTGPASTRTARFVVAQ